VLRDSGHTAQIGMLVGALAAPVIHYSAGSHIGAYRLIHRIGQGGMGDVFAAERADNLFRRKVALKLMRSRFDGGAKTEIIARFEAERRILAALNHPNIARIVDGGVSEHGVPYVVMDYVDGVPLDRYCSAQSLDLSSIIRLFRQVCEAVQYAHRNLIVHRDIKPDNILVTDDGRPVLLDFGIAKLLRPEFLGIGANETRAGVHLMTPEFASPEQFRGERVNTASDIYSLGVLLYFLVTGSLPHDGDDLTITELGRLVCEAEPARPSLRSPGVPQDIDSIILKALRKEPEARYLSVDELSSDLKRYLDGFPVRARGGNWRYQSAKFLRRHWLAVAFSAILSVVVAGSAVALATMARNWRDERDTANASTEFLVDLLESTNPNEKNGSHSIQARAILDEAARQLASDSLKEQPRVRARLTEKIGDIYRQLGAFAEAQSLFELSVSLHEQVYGPDHPQTGTVLVRLADLLRERHQYPAAEKAARRSLLIRRNALGPRHHDVADSLNIIGILLQIQAKPDEAEQVFREALSIRRQTLAPDSHLLALSLGNLGNVLRDKQDLRGADECFKEALAIRRKIWGPDHPRVASSLGQLSQVALMQGRVEEAVLLTAEAVQISRKAYQPDNPDLARALTHHGNALRAAKRYAESETLLTEALAIQQKARGSRAPEVAFVQSDLGATYLALGRRADAAQLLGESLAIRVETLGPEHPLTLKARKSLENLR
jgi:serine/threonine protein kinase